LDPTVVALFTDYVFRAESQIGYSLSAIAALLGVLGALGSIPMAAALRRQSHGCEPDLPGEE
jgi:hypothetical protein